MKVSATLWLLLAVGSAVTPAMAQVSGTGGLLPLQDRVGNPALAVVVEETLRDALSGKWELVEPSKLRDAQRRLRLRDTGTAAPADLAALGKEAGAQWLFSATLHQASRRETTRATRAFTGERAAAGPMPQITLSARVLLLNGGAELGWAGFASASGLDHRRLLGLGVTSDAEELARAVARELAESFLEGAPGRAVDAAPDGFLRASLTAADLGTVAVVPFLGASERDAVTAGEAVTELARAVLHERGVRQVVPGLVHAVLRGLGTRHLGEIGPEARERLHAAGVSTILTGIVEGWEVRGATEPEPRVAFGARLVDAETGSILWMNGEERSGWKPAGAFGTGRVYARGRLAEDIMRSLVADFLGRGAGAGP